MGYSVGKWDGATLVVDTRFNGKARLDQVGRPSPTLPHVIERCGKDFAHDSDHHRRSQGHTKPWTVNQDVHRCRYQWSICNENNKDVEHLPGN
jgi:hypothetical protein